MVLHLRSIQPDSYKKKLLDQIKFSLVFDCTELISNDVEFNIIYSGDPEVDEYDQILCEELVGPIPAGKVGFELETNVVDFDKIPPESLFGVTSLILVGKYNDQEFLRAGFFVNVEYPGETNLALDVCESDEEIDEGSEYSIVESDESDDEYKIEDDDELEEEGDEKVDSGEDEEVDEQMSDEDGLDKKNDEEQEDEDLGEDEEENEYNEGREDEDDEEDEEENEIVDEEQEEDEEQENDKLKEENEPDEELEEDDEQEEDFVDNEEKEEEDEENGEQDKDKDEEQNNVEIGKCCSEENKIKRCKINENNKSALKDLISKNSSMVGESSFEEINEQMKKDITEEINEDDSKYLFEYRGKILDKRKIEIEISEKPLITVFSIIWNEKEK